MIHINQENAPPRRKTTLYYPSQPKPRPVRLREKNRGPYDELRPWSIITHGTGAALALLGTVLLLLRCAALSLSPWHVVSFFIYGVSVVGLYTTSTLYHRRNVSVKDHIVLRKYDHASIYFLIAGIYTPICLVVLRTDGIWGWALLGAIWALALAGLVLTLAWITAPRWLTAGIHIFMGRLAVVALAPLLCLFPLAGFFWALGGGILYTVGGVFYAVRWPGRDNPRFGCHEIFYPFILMGSVFHLMFMYRVVAFL